MGNLSILLSQISSYYMLSNHYKKLLMYQDTLTFSPHIHLIVSIIMQLEVNFKGNLISESCR